MRWRKPFLVVVFVVGWILAGCLPVFTASAWGLAIRVICGKSDAAYTDTHGYTWSTDQAYSSGSWGYTNTGGTAQFLNVIEDTYDGPLYQQERLNCVYRFDVPAGTYFVKLLFAEIYWGLPANNHAPNDRVFNVMINGQTVLSNFSPLQSCGGRADRALVQPCTVTVTNTGTYANCIVLTTSASVDQSKFSAIEISDVPTLTDTLDNYSPASPTDEEVFRINCGGTKTRDADGTLWMADEPFALCQRWGYQGGNAAAVPETWNTPDQVRLDTWREGSTDFQYILALPNGSYQVKLFFAEHTYSSPGQRVFDVSVNGSTVAQNLDVFSQVGAASGLTLTAQATVSNERLTVTFPRIAAGQAMLSALEVKAITVSDAAFLDFVERRSIDYFTQTAAPFCTVNPLNGLTRDRMNNFITTLSWSSASTAATGFGAAALAVGQSRGWLSASQASTQLTTVLNFFNQAVPYTSDSQNCLTQQSGFFFHYLDIQTGQRYNQSELSSIDTAWLFAGLLTAKNLFSSAIRDQIDRLMGRTDWVWFTRGDSRGFAADAWTPETGFTPYSWSGYNEDVVLDMIGMGSRQHALSPACWFNMTRVWFDCGGVSAMIEVKDQPTPLFTHLYPQCFLDLRHMHDDKNDYFHNTQLAVQLDQKFCQDHPASPTYAAGNWGLSAGDSPQGGFTYYAYKTLDTGQDGTVNPAMVGAAVPFAPETAIPTLRRMFFRYKQFLWGRFGFSNTFNLCAPKTMNLDSSGKGWVSPDVIGIDLGAMILGIENYRTGMVWKNIAADAGVQLALTQTGFFNKTIDDFENDRSPDSQPLARDGQWSISNSQVFSLAVTANVQGNTTACLAVICQGKPDPSQDYVQIGQLSQPAKMSYYSSETSLSLQAAGAQSFRLRFRDSSGQESATSGPLIGNGNGSWKNYVWNYSGLDWKQCDSRCVDAILLFPEPASGSPAVYLDALALGDGTGPAPAVATPAGATPTSDPPITLTAYPNPAPAWVHFAFSAMSGGGAVALDLYNLAGERVAHLQGGAPAGQPFEIVWQRGRTAPGVYFYRVRVKDQSNSLRWQVTRKLALL